MAVLVLVSLVLAPVASADPRPVELRPGYRLFSPNGDGSKDRLPVRFTLRERAAVTVQVRAYAGREVRLVRLGALSAGKHAWRWNGRDDAGRPVPNGSYRLRVAAVGGSRTGVARMGVGVDRGQGLRKARVWVSRDTVYPSTPDIDDRIHFRSTTGGIHTDFEIRDATGLVVRRDRIHGWASWAGRDDAGALLPPGEYDARFTLGDHYGNVRTTHRTVTISDQTLHPEIWSTTVRAADADLIWPDGWCPPAPSGRFDGGVTVAVHDGCEHALFRPKVDLPFRLDPSSSWRVSVTGGPTTPGEPDSGVISLRADPSVAQTPTAPGDATTTTPWGQVARYEWARPQGWVFYLMVGGPDTSYDVASFTIEVRRYLPPA